MTCGLSPLKETEATMRQEVVPSAQILDTGIQHVRLNRYFPDKHDGIHKRWHGSTSENPTARPPEISNILSCLYLRSQDENEV